MYNIEIERYQEYIDEYGLGRKNPEKGDDWMYFYRKWDSQLHDILNLTIDETINGEKMFLEFDWMAVYKAEWYKEELKITERRNFDI